MVMTKKNSFSKGVEAFNLGFLKGSEESVRVTALKTFTAITFGSPVETGRFRANWFATGSKPSVKSSEGVDKSGNSAVSAMQQVVLGLKDWSVFTYANNLPYSEVIEFGGYPNPSKEGNKTKGGYSKQAPSGVVRINIARAGKLLEAEARKKLPK